MERITNIQENVLGVPERNYKDTLFRKIFGAEDKRSSKWRLELYNALSGKNHTNSDDLEITTLENVLYIKMKNDVSFLVDSQMTLWEHQSTLNPNMPLRGFLYFSVLYQKHLKKLKEDLFTTRQIMIPAPRYIVFYNGNADAEDVIKYKLSDAFIDFSEKGDFEWTATMININKNHNERLHKKCKPLYDYCSFVDRIKNNIKNNMEKEAAIDEAIEWAIKENLLEGYFEEQRAEVKAVILTDFDQEQYDRNRRREGYEEGIAKGAQQKAVEAALELLKEKIAPEIIAKCVNLPLEKVLELQEQITVKA